MTGQLGSSRLQGQGEEEEDYVNLLDEGESLELIQFDPTVEDENAWDAGEVINGLSRSTSRGQSQQRRGKLS